jgi:hypothetical protein
MPFETVFLTYTADVVDFPSISLPKGKRNKQTNIEDEENNNNKLCGMTYSAAHDTEFDSHSHRYCHRICQASLFYF